MKLHNQIIKLIESKKEGEYWDFKRIPHENNASLLHDVLCLANCSHSGSRFLIIGVADPNKGTEILGLKANQENRKSQAGLIDFLRSKSFAGHRRPDIQIHSLTISDKEIDVIEILDEPYKPYYLTEDYRDKEKVVKGNAIYTRINDSNTPIDSSADISQIEKMWRQRFGIDSPPLERMKAFLSSPEDWFKDIGNVDYCYHNFSPEFRIEFSECEMVREPFSYFFINESSYHRKVQLLYHNTTLYEFDCIYCDEMRIKLPYPEQRAVRVNNELQWFYYYDLSEIEGYFLRFITNNSFRLESRGSMFPCPIFQNSTYLDSYVDFLVDDIKELIQIKPSYHAIGAIKRKERWNDKFPFDPIFQDQVYQHFKSWVLNRKVTDFSEI